MPCCKSKLRAVDNGAVALNDNTAAAISPVKKGTVLIVSSLNNVNHVSVHLFYSMPEVLHRLLDLTELNPHHIRVSKLYSAIYPHWF